MADKSGVQKQQGSAPAKSTTDERPRAGNYDAQRQLDRTTNSEEDRKRAERDRRDKSASYCVRIV